ncbi:hypothetical protein GCM10017786_31260 [Amycolatopsis deserti]|uniref:Uncharacterized protein n=1 Tax=Amycolatopsis deserti TaxID=185696 RepID=A0ABQ3IWA3_9PSEU|nr:hypothetical protein GCM10017786_31260 [Amycolatopsis deserti]
MCRAGREDPPDRAARKARVDLVAPVDLVVAVRVDRVVPVDRVDPRRPRSRPRNVRRRSLPRPAAAC